MVVLSYVSYTDLKNRIIPNEAVLTLLIYSFFIIDNYKQSIVMGLFVFLLHLVLAVITNGGVGGGDIKLMSVMAFMMGFNVTFLVLPLAVMMVLTAIYCITTRKGLKYTVPLAPYIFLSYITLLVLECYFERRLINV